MKFIKLVFLLLMFYAPNVWAEDIVINTNTGAGSTNEASFILEISESVNNNNDTNVKNEIVFDANTGENEASKNTGGNSLETGSAGIGGGSISTGNAEVIVTIENTDNTNKTKISACCENDKEGKGGGSETLPITPTKEGIGGGGEIAQVFSEGMLPSAGQNNLDFWGITLGLPLLLLMLARIREIKSQKIYA